MSKYGKYTGNQLEDLGNRLGGEKVIDGILDGTIEFVAKVRDTAVKAIPFLTNTYKQKVNYDRSISDSIKAGDYDNVGDNITDKNFLSSESGEKEVEFGIFHFNEAMISKYVIAEMKEVGYRPATMKELLAFGEKNPGLQMKFPILALGAVAKIDGKQLLGYLDKSDAGRCACEMPFFGDSWHPYYHFLAVRN